MPQAALIDDGITYDRTGRMQYNPVFHENHRKPFTEDDREYICKYYYIDGARYISYAIGRTERAIEKEISVLKSTDRFDYYKNLNINW